MRRPNAAVAGMHDDLETNKGYRYSIATLVFFVTYTVFQPPATVITYKIGPRIFLPSLCVLWGIVMVGHDWSISKVLSDIEDRSASASSMIGLS